MTKRTLERMEELLDAREAEIEELKEELQKNEYQMDGDVWGWTRHCESDEAEGLPVPRLEMRWEDMDPDGSRYNWRCRYDLVYRHTLGHVVKVPMGMTRTTGGASRVTDGVVDTPFRDGCHILHDAYCLKLPAFAICGETINKLEPRHTSGYAPGDPIKPKEKRRG